MSLKHLIFGLPKLNYFRTVRAVLERNSAAIAELQEVTTEQFQQMMICHLKQMSEEYYKKQKPKISYDDPICRAAYLYCYVAANANLCERAIKNSDDLKELIETRCDEEGELKVCAFGGGPGTELLALAKYLIGKRKKGPPITLSFLLLDDVPEWAETWFLLEGQIRKFLKEQFGKNSSWPFTVSRSFVPFDMTDLSQFGNIQQLFGHDLYIFNYVISEIYEDEGVESMQKVVEAMAATAPVGSKVLIIDRKESSIIQRAKDLLENSGLSASEPVESVDNMDSDEQCSELGDQLISERSPRLKWNSFWIIGTKE